MKYFKANPIAKILAPHIVVSIFVLGLILFLYLRDTETPDPSLDNVILRDPVWSPDGTQIAFSTLPGQRIWTIDADGSNLTNVSRFLDGIYGDPAWSATEDLIAFVARQDDNPTELWLIDADGSNRRLLTHQIDNSVGFFQWSPDGESIALTTQTQLGNLNWQHEIHIIALDGTILTSTYPEVGKDIFTIAWSPDGETVIYTLAENRFSEIWTLSVSDSTTSRLFESETAVLLPTWSPDGSAILFLGSCAIEGLDVFMLVLQTNEVKNLTNGRCNTVRMSPRWSPDSTSVLFLTSFANSENFWDLALIDTQSYALENLTTETFGDVRDPFWAPDGENVGFVSNRDGAFDIWVMNIEEGVSRNLTGAYRGR